MWRGFSIRQSKPQIKYVFYDLETRTLDNKHEAVFVCAIDFENEQWCASGVDFVDLFVKKYNQPKYKNYTIIAHNASGFENYTVLNYFTQRITPKLIMSGSKVL